MELTDQANTRVYVKIAKTFPSTDASLDKGMIGPVTSRNTRYVFAQSGRGQFEEVGQLDIINRKLLDVKAYGSDNCRDARIVIHAFLES